MAIRIFINQWVKETLGDGSLYVKDPIDEYLADVSLSAPVSSRNFYARIGATKRPDRVYLIKLMKGDLQQAEWDGLAAISGVRAVPPFRFDAPTTDIKTNLRNKIYAALDALGIPRTTLDSAPTFGTFLRNVLRELDEQNTGFGADELTPEDWA